MNSSPLYIHEDSAWGLLEMVLSRYEAAREVSTDEGREFMGEFEALLVQH